MDTFLKLCMQRYSVRSYQPQLPEKEKLDYVLECVRMAPSAVNFQPWRLRYVTKAEELARLAECYNREWFKHIPACFVVYRDASAEWVRKSDSKPHGDIDVAIAVEHLCLGAAEQGLGTCWVCNFDVTACKQVFPVADQLIPVALVPIGYAAEEPKEKNRKDLTEILL